MASGASGASSSVPGGAIDPGSGVDSPSAPAAPVGAGAPVIGAELSVSGAGAASAGAAIGCSSGSSLPRDGSNARCFASSFSSSRSPRRLSLNERIAVIVA